MCGAEGCHCWLLCRLQFSVCTGRDQGLGLIWPCSVCCAQVDDATLEVTELPVRKWTQDYKEFLEGLIKPDGEKAGPPVLADFREHHSDADVHFSLQLLPGQMGPCMAADLHAKFKLTSKISCSARAPPAPCYTLILCALPRQYTCLYAVNICPSSVQPASRQGE